MNETTNRQAGTKPLGLILVAIYSGVSALLGVLGGFGLMAGGQMQMHQWAPILGFGLLLVGVLFGAVAYGLWVLAPWSYSLTRNLCIASIPLGVLMILPDRTAGNIVLQLVGIGIAIWILVYLAKPEVKGLFQGS